MHLCLLQLLRYLLCPMKQRFEMIGMYVVEVEGISKRRVNKSEIGCERFLKLGFARSLKAQTQKIYQI